MFQIAPQKFKNNHKNVLKGALFSSLGTVVSSVINVILIGIAVRALPKEMSGVYFLCLNFSAFILLADIGLSPTLSREIAFSLGNLDAVKGQKRIKVLLRTAIHLLFVATLISFFAALLIGWFYFSQTVSDEYQSQVMFAWTIFALGSALNLFSLSGFAGLYGLGFVPIERTGRIIGQLIGLLLSIVAVYLGLGLLGLCFAWLGQGLAMCIIGWSLLIRKQPTIIIGKVDFDNSLSKEILAKSSRWGLTSLGGFLIFNATNFMIGYYLSAKAVSDFSLIVRMAQPIQSIGLAMTVSAIPHISREYAAGNSPEVTRILIRNLQIGMMIVTIPLFLIGIFAPKILQIWVGEGHFAGYEVLIPYLVMIVLDTHHVIHASAVMATGDLPFAPWAIGSGILTIIFGVLFIPNFGLLGASLSLMIAQLLTNNWYVPYFSYFKFFYNVGRVEKM